MLRRPQCREPEPFGGNRDNPEEVRFGRRADTDREEPDFHILPPQLPGEFAAPFRRRREMAGDYPANRAWPALPPGLPPKWRLRVRLAQRACQSALPRPSRSTLVEAPSLTSD